MKIDLFDKFGRKLDATVIEEQFENCVEYIFESSGGGRGTPVARNIDYQAAMDVLLKQLCQKRMHIEDILVVSQRLEKASHAEKQVIIPNYPFPINLSQIDNLIDLRRKITRAAAMVGSKSKIKGAGNRTRRLWMRASLAEPGAILNNLYKTQTFEKKPPTAEDLYNMSEKGKYRLVSITYNQIQKGNIIQEPAWNVFMELRKKYLDGKINILTRGN